MPFLKKADKVGRRRIAAMDVGHALVPEKTRAHFGPLICPMPAKKSPTCSSLTNKPFLSNHIL